MVPPPTGQNANPKGTCINDDKPRKEKRLPLIHLSIVAPSSSSRSGEAFFQGLGIK